MDNTDIKKIIDQKIKMLSLDFTDTVKDWPRFDQSKVDNLFMNTEESISLYDLVYAFNKLYLAFKKEYNQLDKLELGEKIVPILAHKSEKGILWNRVLLSIRQPYICNAPDVLLSLEEYDGEISANITYVNDKEGRVCREIDLDKKKVKQYIDVFTKYNLLLELYEYLKVSSIRFNSTSIVCTYIYSDGDDMSSLDNWASLYRDDKSILENLKGFYIVMGTAYMNGEDIFKIFISLDEKIDIDLGKSEIKFIYHKDINVDKETYIQILRNTYIHGRYLDEYSKREKVKINKAKLLKKEIN